MSIKYLHYCQLVAGVIFALAFMLMILTDFSYRPLFSVGQLCISMLLLSFSVAHIYVLRKFGVDASKALFFSPIYILGFYVFNSAWIGELKGWAPYASDEALMYKTLYFLSALALFVGAVYSLRVAHGRSA